MSITDRLIGALTDFEVNVVLDSSPEEVFEVVADVATWTSWLYHGEMKVPSGEPVGVGTIFVRHWTPFFASEGGGEDTMTCTVTELILGQRFVFESTARDEWQKRRYFEIAGDPRGAKVTYGEDFLKNNHPSRFLRGFVLIMALLLLPLTILVAAVTYFIWMPIKRPEMRHRLRRIDAQVEAKKLAAETLGWWKKGE